jgi:hypothetical protein
MMCDCAECKGFEEAYKEATEKLAVTEREPEMDSQELELLLAPFEVKGKVLWNYIDEDALNGRR